MDGMTIEGVAVTELMAAYRASKAWRPGILSSAPTAEKQILHFVQDDKIC
jgi:hypothetical protein